MNALLHRIMFGSFGCFILIAPTTTRADDPATTRPVAHVNHAGLVKLGWQLACRALTFQDRTTFEMIDLLHSMGFHHIELSTGQTLSPDRPGVKIETGLAAQDVDALLAKLKSVHMDVVSFGVVDHVRDEAAARKVFELGSKFKLKTLVVDLGDDSMGMFAKLADEYRINVAIENLTRPGNHWDADALAASLSGRSNRIGVCADVANWRKSGLEPLDCVRKLKGRILEVHLSDLEDPGPVLGELHEQGFKGTCAIECAGGSGQELVDRFTLSVNAFSDVVGDLSGIH